MAERTFLDQLYQEGSPMNGLTEVAALPGLPVRPYLWAWLCRWWCTGFYEHASVQNEAADRAPVEQASGQRHATERTILYIDTEGSFHLACFYTHAMKTMQKTVPGSDAAAAAEMLKSMMQKMTLKRLYDHEELAHYIESLSETLRNDPSKAPAVVIIDSLAFPYRYPTLTHRRSPSTDNQNNLKHYHRSGKSQHLFYLVQQLNALSGNYGCRLLYTNHVTTKWNQCPRTLPAIPVYEEAQADAGCSETRIPLYRIAHADRSRNVVGAAAGDVARIALLDGHAGRAHLVPALDPFLVHYSRHRILLTWDRGQMYECVLKTSDPDLTCRQKLLAL